MTNLETVVWAQEEPKNNGAWFFVESLIEECLAQAGVAPKRAGLCRPQGIGRDRDRAWREIMPRSRRRSSRMRSGMK